MDKFLGGMSNKHPQIERRKMLNINSEKNRQQMIKIAQYRMPFGKYKGSLLVDLPEPYVVWFAEKGFPKGELGEMLGVVHTIKVNGLEYLFKSK